MAHATFIITSSSQLRRCARCARRAPRSKSARLAAARPSAAPDPAPATNIGQSVPIVRPAPRKNARLGAAVDAARGRAATTTGILTGINDLPACLVGNLIQILTAKPAGARNVARGLAWFMATTRRTCCATTLARARCATGLLRLNASIVGASPAALGPVFNTTTSMTKATITTTIPTAGATAAPTTVTFRITPAVVPEAWPTAPARQGVAGWSLPLARPGCAANAVADHACGIRSHDFSLLEGGGLRECSLFCDDDRG